ncbi:15023_t:CDS:2, partial [Cetraspora pellucida]
TTENYDAIVCAKIPDPVVNPKVYDSISKYMLHRPCGELNLNAPCMIDDGMGYKRCSKGYPKQFQNETSQGKNSYPIYHRRQDNYYVEIRVGTLEAVWRILGFRMNKINLAVTHLHLHLPNQQRIIFSESSVLTEVIEVNQNNCTTLTEQLRGRKSISVEVVLGEFIWHTQMK